jgi:hypothetical protein
MQNKINSYIQHRSLNIYAAKSVDFAVLNKGYRNRFVYYSVTDKKHTTATSLDLEEQILKKSTTQLT